MIKRIVTLRELPKILQELYSKNNTFKIHTTSQEIIVNSYRTKSNVAEINGLLYYFGNTFGNISPYRTIKRFSELVEFCTVMSDHMDTLIAKKTTDVTYLNVSDLMNHDNIAEKILTVKDVVYPDYIVESFNAESLEVEIQDDFTSIRILDNVVISKLSRFDLSKIFKQEYLNSLYIVKMTHNRNLDISGVMNLLPQLEVNKTIDIVTILNNKHNISVCLHIPERLIDEVFGYKLKKRTSKVRVDDLTSLYISQSIKS